MRVERLNALLDDPYSITAEEVRWFINALGDPTAPTLKPGRKLGIRKPSRQDELATLENEVIHLRQEVAFQKQTVAELRGTVRDQWVDIRSLRGLLSRTKRELTECTEGERVG